MEAIVHYGMAKTGTTSIQMALHSARSRLRERGLLYPVTGGGRAHHILTALFKPFEDVRPAMRHRAGYDPARLHAAARRAWDSVKWQVDRAKPERVVLSSEMFFGTVSVDGQGRFRERLEEIFPSITICLYVRSPASHFRSLAQQETKSAGAVSPPHPLSVRESIEIIERVFGKRLIVRPFERSQLQDGDVVSDLMGQVIGSPELAQELRGPKLNESLSAEAMSISTRYRKATFPDLDGVQTAESRLLVKRLSAIEQAAGRSGKPKLKPEIARAIVHASSDLHWLRDRYGIAFGDVDYAAVDGMPLTEFAGLTQVEDLFEVDEAWRDELLYYALHEGVETRLSLDQMRRVVPQARIASALGLYDGAMRKIRHVAARLAPRDARS
jgi:hypothetical protein